MAVWPAPLKTVMPEAAPGVTLSVKVTVWPPSMLAVAIRVALAAPLVDVAMTIWVVLACPLMGVAVA